MDKYIAPSILSADFGYLVDDIKAIENQTKYLHIDIMDGHFVPNLSIGIPVVKSIRKYTDLIFDVHLMIDNPEKFIKPFIDAGSDIITFHIECTDDPDRLISIIRGYGKKAGISIHPDTPIERIFPFLEQDRCDLILVMSVVPGLGGQTYLPSSTDKIREIRRQLDINGSDAILSVDGGINVDTIRLVSDAGATLFVAGSSVFGKENKAKAVEELLLRI